MALSIVVLLSAGLHRRLARAHRRAARRRPRSLLLLAFCVGDDLDRHVDRPHGALARRGDGRRLRRRVPADVPEQRVRADRLAARRVAVGRGVEPDQRDGRRRCASCSATRCSPITKHTWPLEHPQSRRSSTAGSSSRSRSRPHAPQARTADLRLIKVAQARRDRCAIRRSSPSAALTAPRTAVPRPVRRGPAARSRRPLALRSRPARSACCRRGSCTACASRPLRRRPECCQRQARWLPRRSARRAHAARRRDAATRWRPASRGRVPARFDRALDGRARAGAPAHGPWVHRRGRLLPRSHTRARAAGMGAVRGIAQLQHCDLRRSRGRVPHVARCRDPRRPTCGVARLSRRVRRVARRHRRAHRPGPAREGDRGRLRLRQGRPRARRTRPCCCSACRPTRGSSTPGSAFFAALLPRRGQARRVALLPRLRARSRRCSSASPASSPTQPTVLPSSSSTER